MGQVRGQGAWKTGCGINLAAYNPQLQKTFLQNVADAESKSTSFLCLGRRPPWSGDLGPEGNGERLKIPEKVFVI